MSSTPRCRPRRGRGSNVLSEWLCSFPVDRRVARPLLSVTTNWSQSGGVQVPRIIHHHTPPRRMHEFIEKRFASPSFLSVRPCLCMALSVIAMPLLADESVIISEFMANNRLAKKTGNLAMVDEDNSREDWIEVFNAGPAPVELDGWSLTDDATDLEKWAFPAKLLAPGQRLIVWASAKDRRDPAKPLHTNFKLDDDGEFLALVHPDGVTIAHQFAPVFPPQAPDVSYGISGAATQVALAGAGSIVKFTVPADAAAEAHVVWRWL